MNHPVLDQQSTTPLQVRSRDTSAVGSSPLSRGLRRTAGRLPQLRTDDNLHDELRLLNRVEQIAKHLRAMRLHAEALAVENLGLMIEMYAEHYRPRPQ